jgi:hypothetical protein
MYKTEITILDYNEFDALVQRVYNRPDYSIVWAEELNNDSSVHYAVGNKDLLEGEEEDLSEFAKGKNGGLYMSFTLLVDLIRRGHLEPGHYLISVCW